MRKIYLLFNSPNLIVQDKNNYSESYLNLPDDTCIVGRWQSETFFLPIEEQVRKEFSFKEKFNSEIIAFSEEINRSNSICVHFRRKDLITSSLYSKTHGVLEMDYYNRAIDLLKAKIPNPHLYVFSDDAEWCKNNFRPDLPFKIIGDEFSANKSAGHLFLMSCCKHFVISNSTFAWWGAWLSCRKEKTVIAPANWYNEPTLRNDLIAPKSWIVL